MVAIAVPLLGATAAVLAMASGRNMLQTYRVFSSTGCTSADAELIDTDGLVDKDRVLEKLQAMPRHELLRLFLVSQHPTDLEAIQGEWNGILLSNNIILTSITNFLSNGLFGWGRKWNGKTFAGDQQGMNRFCSRKTPGVIEEAHRFDYSLAFSSLDREAQSVRLLYAYYQNPLSLWKTMRDEVRWMKLPHDCQIEVLIGMGCMAWSGRALNSSPFCLWRPKK
jgi:hypothetical protein